MIETDDGKNEEWEKNVRKHIFILSSSGKPIFSRYGQEQELVTTFGLLQAVLAIIEDSGDIIRCIKAGKRRIVYFIRKSLYFVSVSSTEEPEYVLNKQLDFMYNRIVFTVTSRIQDMLQNNSSKDLRDFLGYDTTRLLHSTCASDFTPISIAFDTVKGFSMEKILRTDLLFHLRTCVEKSNTALGLIFYGDSLVVYCLSDEMQLSLTRSDFILLSHFVGNSSSLRSHDQNWVPICLPGFNNNAFLQAYICDFKLNLTLNKNEELISLSSSAASKIESKIDSKSLQESRRFTLLLIATSSEGVNFHEITEAKDTLQNVLESSHCHDSLVRAVRINSGPLTLSSSIETSLAPTTPQAIHALLKWTPKHPPPSDPLKDSGHPPQSLSSSVAAIIANMAKYPQHLLPSQYAVFQSANKLLADTRCEAFENMLWPQYQRLSLALHKGSAAPEVTLLQPPATHTPPHCANPIAYVVLPSGHTLVAIAALDTELYAAYPSYTSVEEATAAATRMIKELQLHCHILFQTSFSE